MIDPLTRCSRPDEGLGELGLAVALHAGDREDLAGAHVEADVVDDDLVLRVDDREALDDERAIAELRRVLVHRQLDGATDHELGELGVRRGRRRFAHDLAEADDGDAVGDLAHLAQLVGDEDDRGARLLELAHDAHQLVGLLRGEHGGRLVEDEHPRVARERLDDLDALLHADREVLDERVGVDVESEARGDLADALARGVQVEDAAGLGGLVAEHDVLGDGEDGDQHEVLMHHADAGAHRVAGALEVLDDVVQEDDAVVCAVQPVQNVHQGRLAGAVLAEEAVDLPGFHHEIDVVVRDEGAEPLGDPAEFELHAPDPSKWASVHREPSTGAMTAGSERGGWSPSLPVACGTSPRGRTRRGSTRR